MRILCICMHTYIYIEKRKKKRKKKKRKEKSYKIDNYICKYCTFSRINSKIFPPPSCPPAGEREEFHERSWDLTKNPVIEADCASDRLRLGVSVEDNADAADDDDGEDEEDTVSVD